MEYSLCSKILFHEWLRPHSPEYKLNIKNQKSKIDENLHDEVTNVADEVSALWITERVYLHLLDSQLQQFRLAFTNNTLR